MGRPPIDLTNQKFGKLTAKEIVERGGAHKSVKWLCECECGGSKIVDSQLLKRGFITDCGCSTKNRLVGKRVGRLTVVANTGKHQSGHVVWLCKCDCGNYTEVITSNLNPNRFNATLSCGCLRKENATKHNLSNTTIYKTLVSIKGRCKNPSSRFYSLYGGRGITLCDEWDGEKGFENFYNWSISNGWKKGLSIDRIDNNKGYSPDNCRWTTQKVQANNTRRNRMITIDGETHSLTEWVEIKGICMGTVADRLKRGWNEIDAIAKPIKKKAGI